MWRAALLRIVFLIAPAIVLSGLAVYWAKNLLVARGVHVNSFLYQSVALVVVWLAMTVTTKPLIDELRKRKNDRSNGN